MVETGVWKNKNGKPGYNYRVCTGMLVVEGRFLQNPARREYYNRINEMRRWCRDNVGYEVEDWNLREMLVVKDGDYPEKQLCFLFKDPVQAAGFMMVFKRGP